MIRLIRPTKEMKEKAVDYKNEHFFKGEMIINGVFERNFEYEGEQADIYVIRL